MRYIFELNHPKHYHQFKHIIAKLEQEGHVVQILARDKDILLRLLDEEGVEYCIFGVYKKNILGKLFSVFSILFSYYKIIKRFNPHIIVSKASPFACFLAKLLKKKSIIFPDSEVVALTNKIVAPLATQVVTPSSFEKDYGAKHIKVDGLFESCYLSSDVFRPDPSIITKYQLKQPYVLFRFVGWNANHDVNNRGLTNQQKLTLIEEASKYMNVYVSDENTTDVEFEKYKLKTPVAVIHHILSFADLYVGDSQTMATEAALLGTPTIRSNSFVGEEDMSNFKILEKQHQLLINININNFDALFNTVRRMVEHSKKTEWQKKQQAYNREIGDVNKQIYDILVSV